MARKSTLEEVTEFLRKRYNYTFLTQHPHAPDMNIAVLAEDDATAWATASKYAPGCKITLITRSHKTLIA